MTRQAQPARVSSQSAASDRLYAGRSRPIRVRVPPEVADRLPLFAADWPHRTDAPAAGAADIAVTQAGAGYRLTAAGGGHRDFAHALDAANGLMGALIEAFVAQDADLVCLHASAARIGAGLAVFIGESGAGKSSLALHLAATGHRFFGDDRLALDLGREVPEGLCLGLAPKARLPLPPEAGAAYRRFVDARRVRTMGELAYLRLGGDEAAPFGAACPLAALVLLARQAPGPARLDPAPRPELVKALLGNAFAPHLAPETLVRRLAALAARVPGHQLRFHDSRAAAGLVADRLAGG